MQAGVSPAIVCWRQLRNDALIIETAAPAYAIEISSIVTNQILGWARPLPGLSGSRLQSSFTEPSPCAACPSGFAQACTPLRAAKRFRFEVARCFQRKQGHLRWRIYAREGSYRHPCAVARLSPGNREVQDWFLLLTVPRFAAHFSLGDPEIQACQICSTAEELTALITRQLLKS